LCDCFNAQYLRKLQSTRRNGDGVKMAETGSGSWWRGASWTTVVHVVLISGRQMSPLDGSSDVFVKFKFASERYKTRVFLTSLFSYSLSYSTAKFTATVASSLSVQKTLKFLLHCTRRIMIVNYRPCKCIATNPTTNRRTANLCC